MPGSRLAHASGARPTTPSVLTEAIRATFERCRTPFPPAMLLGLQDQFGEDALKRKQWSAFLAKNRLAAPPLSVVVRDVRAFVEGPLRQAFDGQTTP